MARCGTRSTRCCGPLSASVAEHAVEQAGEAFRALRRGITRSRGFSLHVCTCDAPASRDQFIANLAASMPAVSVHRVNLTKADADVLDAVATVLADASPGPVMVVGCEDVLADAAQAQHFLSSLNLRRVEWPARIACPVVFWVPRRLLGILTSGAPDFFDWRSDTIAFPEIGTGEALSFAPRDWKFGVDPRFSGQEREERLRELKARIAASGRADDENLLRHQSSWWDEIADLELVRGNVDEALRIRNEEQLPVFERLGDVREKAVTMGQIADMLQARGQLDEALRIRNEEELPVYERLGDVRGKAVTMGQIADILQARGQFDDALRIRQDEELPVFERLGDVREKAVTMGKIADILQARGQLDDALRIRQEEQLPVYERLGDVRGKAVTMGKIADILHARGQLDDALRIHNEDELPIYERLGDVREKAVAMGKIADILRARGQLDDALRIRNEEELPVYERLGDVRSQAVTMGNIADILQARGQLDEALALHEQRLPIAQRLGDIDSLAHIRYSIAALRLQRGEHETGGLQTIHDELAEAFAISVKLGRADGIAAIGKLLAQVLAMAGQREQALGVLEQAESAYAKLDNAQGLASVRDLRKAVESA
jgi:tetratricopeptide (TPR) repeat protein